MSNLYNLLSDNEKKSIETYIDTYGISGNCSRKASLETLLQYWDDAKSEYLYNLLGKNLMISMPIESIKTVSEISDEINNKMLVTNSNTYEFYSKIRQISYDMKHKLSEARGGSYIYDNRTEEEEKLYLASEYILTLITPYSLSKNTWEYNNFAIPLPNGKDLKVNKGSKIIKTLGKIAEAFNIEGFEEFRIAHSMCLNEKSIKGELVLSIHPLDYMTMSDNSNNWSSCMSWRDFGDFRRGTVEMMNSKYVVCAYLKSDSEYISWNKNNYTWNSKKWRELFIVSEDTIAGIKGYPYWNRDLETQVINILKNLAQKNLNWGRYSSNPEYIFVDTGEMFTFNEFSKKHSFHFCTDTMYSDFYDSHQIVVSQKAPTVIEINYSGFSECMSCGSIYNYFDNESELVCDNCNPIYTCSCCGERFDYESDLIEVDGQLYCGYCYEHELSRCSICEDAHIDSEFTYIYLANEQGILKQKCIALCYDCLLDNTLIKKDKIKTGRRTQFGPIYNYIFEKDCSEYLLEVFEKEKTYYFNISDDNILSFDSFIYCNLEFVA